MVTRLPHHLDAFGSSPSPSVQTEALPGSTLSKPWRGLFLVSGTRASDVSSNVEIRVTGVETDGDIKSHIWPPRIVFSIMAPHALPVLPQLREYIKTRFPPIPLTTFLPERLRDPDRDVVNQTHFHSLSRMLWDCQLVAVVPISPSDCVTSGSFPLGMVRHGMLIYPAANSTSLLIGAIFLTSEYTFPDFVLSADSTTFSETSSEIPSRSLTIGYSAFRNEDTISVPISPTVIHSQSRQDSQQRLSSRSYSSLREPSVRISSLYRYSPVPSSTSQGLRVSFPQARSSFVPSTTNTTPQGGSASLTYSSDHPRGSSAYSAHSDTSLEQRPSQPFFHSQHTTGESSHLSERAPSNSPQITVPDQPEKEDSMAASIFNPFDLTTQTRGH